LPERMLTCICRYCWPLLVLCIHVTTLLWCSHAWQRCHFLSCQHAGWRLHLRRFLLGFLLACYTGSMHFLMCYLYKVTAVQFIHDDSRPSLKRYIAQGCLLQRCLGAVCAACTLLRCYVCCALCTVSSGMPVLLEYCLSHAFCTACDACAVCTA
jgi:hypothetical protein